MRRGEGPAVRFARAGPSSHRPQLRYWSGDTFGGYGSMTWFPSFVPDTSQKQEGPPHNLVPMGYI